MRQRECTWRPRSIHHGVAGQCPCGLRDTNPRKSSTPINTTKATVVQTPGLHLLPSHRHRDGRGMTPASPPSYHHQHRTKPPRFPMLALVPPPPPFPANPGDHRPLRSPPLVVGAPLYLIILAPPIRFGRYAWNRSPSSTGCR